MLQNWACDLGLHSEVGMITFQKMNSKVMKAHRTNVRKELSVLLYI